ncbi:MAG: hypothetical protein WBA17_14230 [Saprospiraceae bacterium]
MSQNYAFEIFCIDPEDILSEQAFVHALSYSALLWGGNEPQIKKVAGVSTLEESETGLCVRILPVDTSMILTGFVEAAFIIKIESQLFEPLEPFRQRILRHLRDNLKFKHIRVLQDDISSEIANQLYPKINAVENHLRRYLIKFFIQRVGTDWWDVTATPKMLEKVKNRLRNRSNQFSFFVDSDVEFADFDDLGLLIYKQSSGFNQPDKVMERLMLIESVEDLDRLKSELRGNYTKYFKQFFRDKGFEQLWKEMSRIRNKVAHQATFFQQELKRGVALADELTKIMREAENHIDEIVLSVQEKQAIRQATIEVIQDAEEEAVLAAKHSEASGENQGAGPAPNGGLPNGSPGGTVSISSGGEQSSDNDSRKDSDNRVKLSGPKVIGKIKLPQQVNTYQHMAGPGYRVITEEEIITELEEALNLSYTDYVGLKWFVTTFLANKGYAIGTTYSLVNILIEQEAIELYNRESTEGYSIKAVRLPL